MITESPKPKQKEEICLMCHRLKSRHSPEELGVCSRKMEEFRRQPKGGAGIQ